MEHDPTWWSFLPALATAERAATEHLGSTWVGHQHVELQHVCAALLVTLFLLILGFIGRARLKQSPDQGLTPDMSVSLRNFFELLTEAIHKQTRGIISHHPERYVPVIGSLALFILFSNLLGLLPGFRPPTDSWNTTLACGLFVFAYYNYHGLRVHGFGHLAHMMNPIGKPWGWALMPLLFPIEIISHLARPLSLSLRLMGNMIGDHAVLAAIAGMVPFLVPLPFYALGFVVCLVQTLVFTLLSMVYISLSTAHAEHHEYHEYEPA